MRERLTQMGKSKKVVLLIVEGSTDQDTLSPILKKIFDKCNVRFFITRGDILVKTEENDITSTNAISKINTCIKNEMRRYGYKTKDMVKVFHLIDTDGAFVPSDRVIFNENENLKYYSDRIETKNVDWIKERNEGKKHVAQRLRSTNKIGGIPYSILFFSRNLEHVLHDIDYDLTQEQKICLADEFADKYDDDIEGFKSLICGDEISVSGTYQETWDYILTDINSLKRATNLHFILEDKQVFSD